MTASKPRRRRDPIVNVVLNGGRVTSGFRATLFAAASRVGVSVNEFVLTAAAEKLRTSRSQFSDVFEPGDLRDINDSHEMSCVAAELKREFGPALPRYP